MTSDDRELLRAITAGERFQDENDYMIGPGVRCPKCSEDRLTTRIVDRRGIQYYCDVCSHSWTPVT